MAVLPPPAPGCAPCAARDAVIAEQGQAIGELRADVMTLAAEVRELRSRLGRNSENSSMPPSSDDLPGGGRPKRERHGQGSGRNRGKQPGAPGASMTRAEPDEVIDHRTAGACGCGMVHAAGRPAGVPDSAASTGPNLRALAVYLVVYQHGN
jgi:transposase